MLVRVIIILILVGVGLAWWRYMVPWNFDSPEAKDLRDPNQHWHRDHATMEQVWHSHPFKGPHRHQTTEGQVL